MALGQNAQYFAAHITCGSDDGGGGDGSLAGEGSGDDCVIEAGLYLTAGTPVTMTDGSVRKARDLSGGTQMLFRRNGATGAVEMVPRVPDWGGLNPELHVN